MYCELQRDLKVFLHFPTTLLSLCYDIVVKAPYDIGLLQFCQK